MYMDSKNFFLNLGIVFLVLVKVCFLIVVSSNEVPVEDQRLAVALLMELAVQRGHLSDMLSAVQLLLDISSDVVDVDRDNRLVRVLTHAPLVPVLRRFQALTLSYEASDSSQVSEVVSCSLYALVMKLLVD